MEIMILNMIMKQKDVLIKYGRDKMPSCELCGVEDCLVDAIVEGSVLKVCSRCKEFGDVIEVHKDEVRREQPKKVYFKEPEEYVVDDYGNKVKNAREKLGLKQEDLAKKINEKESTIHKVESRQLKPSIILANKFEKFLSINLIEKYKETEKPKIDFRSGSLTVGDLLRLKKK